MDRRTRGTEREEVLDDLREREGTWEKRRVERYFGVREGESRQRKAMVAVLKVILCLTGSQPNSLRSRLELVDLPLRSVRWAAAFWTFWRGAMVLSVSPASRENNQFATTRMRGQGYSQQRG